MRSVPGHLKPLLPDTALVTAEGHLAVGGCDLVSLAAQYGTPLYVYDEATIRTRLGAYAGALAESYSGLSAVCYASKAYCAPWLLQIVNDAGASLDVVSGGELYAALRVGFAMERVYFHGNNKSPDELRMAVAAGVGRIVVDNLEEVHRLSAVATDAGVRQAVLLRVTPGVEAHTHEYIKTGIADTKFGLNIASGAALEAASAILADPALDLLGLHAHIGSQIFEIAPYCEAISRMLTFAATLRAAHPNFDLRELSPGGGFGVQYTVLDDPPAISVVIAALAAGLLAEAARQGFVQKLPKLVIEPGRSIVATAAVALYRVGSVKNIPGLRTYVAVDGGMADNIRPAIYGAVYATLLANRVCDPIAGTYTIAGKYCESGDILVREAHLPSPCVEDLVAIPGSGAYNLAMASNYNAATRPAVVAVCDGAARLVTRRETFEDLYRTQV